MPDFSNCIKDKNDEIWCFDKETNSVCKIIVEHPVSTTIPQEVLIELLKAESRRNNHAVDGD